MRIFRVVPALASVCLLATAHSSTAQTRVLHEVAFTGAPGYTQAELIAFTGLKPGGSATQQQVQDAAQRLGDTGLFEDVNFSGNDKGVTFILKPAPANTLLHARFRNFVWWQDDEIEATLKARVPLYRGDAVPATGNMTDSISAVLKAMLEEKGLTSASVGSVPSQSGKGGAVDRITFSIDSPQVVVRSLTLSGISPAMQAHIERVPREIKGAQWDESASYIDVATRVSEVYLNDGYLDIAVSNQQHGPPVVTADNIALDLTAKLDEGTQYHVSQVAWSGSEFLSTADFNHQAKLKPGDPDSPVALRETLATVRAAYGTKGYIDAQATAPPVIDRVAHQVAYTVSVAPGQQYRFKSVSWPTLSADQAKAFDAAWQMKPGDIYNSGYVMQFLQKNSSLAKQNLSVRVDVKRNPDLTVDLAVSFPPNKSQ